MYRTWVITRHTFFEAISQPIYSLLQGLGAAILVIFMFLPFFTLGEDTVMFKSVGLDIILLLVLLTTLFATSRCIHEEIEDRTMLTLMSKPVSRLEVLLGKYLGLSLSAALGVGLAAFLSGQLPRLFPPGQGTPPLPTMTVMVFVWAAICACAVALLSSAMPALRLARMDIATALSGRAT